MLLRSLILCHGHPPQLKGFASDWHRPSVSPSKNLQIILFFQWWTSHIIANPHNIYGRQANRRGSVFRDRFYVNEKNDRVAQQKLLTIGLGVCFKLERQISSDQYFMVRRKGINLLTFYVLTQFDFPPYYFIKSNIYLEFIYLELGVSKVSQLLPWKSHQESSVLGLILAEYREGPEHTHLPTSSALREHISSVRLLTAYHRQSPWQDIRATLKMCSQNEITQNNIHT